MSSWSSSKEQDIDDVGCYEKAHSTILLSLSDEVLYEVADEETAAGVWKNSALKDHLDSLNSILMDLKNVEVKIDDEDVALILLVSLPPSFENFVNSFVVGKDTITLEDVRSKKGQVAAVAKDDSGSERDVVLSVVDYKGTLLVWIMDSACSFNMSPNQDWFVTYEEFDDGHVFMGNDSPCKVVGIGTIRIKMHDGVVRTLTDVRHVTDLKKNLISLGVLDSKGFNYTSENDVLHVSKGALAVMKATKGTSSLYTLQGETITGSTSVSCSEKSNSDLTMLWHMRLGHMSKKGMVILRNKSGYFLSIIDDFSRMTWVFMKKNKSATFEKFKHWKILIENQTGRKIKHLCTDNGLEFCSREFDDFCRDEGIARHYTVRYTPQQNRVAERMNKTVLERTRCLQLNAKLDKSFLTESLNTACYLINRSPVTAIDCKTPIEVWSGKPADYSKLCVFGCPAYYHVSEGKLAPRGEKGIFMGYGNGVKDYRIWSPLEKRVILRRDVTFDEDYLFCVKQDPIESKLEDSVSEKVEDVHKQVEHVVPGDMDHDVTSLDDHTNLPHLEHEQHRSIAHDRPRRNVKAPTRFDSDIWIAAMGEEIESLHKNNTWELVKLLEKRKVVGLHHNLELEQLDVKTAFLHGDLEEEIYMSQPDVVQGKEDYVCKLHKSLYGLKQSPRQWYKRFDTFMVKHGFSRTAKDMDEVKKLKILLNTEFDMKDLGAARKILGMEIIRDRKHGKLFLSQNSYIEKIISRFGMSSAKLVNTPSSVNFRLSITCAPQTEAEIKYMSRIPYASVAGSLMYAIVCTRPDIAHAMSVVSRYMAHPGKEHWNAVKRIFRYLKGTSDVGLIYGGEREYLVVGYSDSDYAADLDARRSLTGYVFTIRNLVVSCKATLQPSVTLSTTKAEYTALTEATKEGIWLKGLIEDLGFPQDQATAFCDSMSAICLAKDQVYHDRTKRIDFRYHFIRTERRIKMKKIGTKDNPADVFTKPVPLSKFRHCLDLLNIDNWKYGVT
ncbi:putative polyprotein [Tanacetum coccineum]